MWQNDPPADPSAMAGLSRIAYFQIFASLVMFGMFAFSEFASLLASSVEACMFFLDCWPICHFGIITYICYSWCKSRNGSFRYSQLTKIVILLILCGSLSIHTGKKG